VIRGWFVVSWPRKPSIERLQQHFQRQLESVVEAADALHFLEGVVHLRKCGNLSIFRRCIVGIDGQYLGAWSAGIERRNQYYLILDTKMLQHHLKGFGHGYTGMRLEKLSDLYMV